MILQNAINTVIESEEFQSLARSGSIELDLCWKIEAKIVNVSTAQRIAIEIRFDFGDEGASEKDIIAHVFVNGNTGAVTIHNLVFNPWYP